MATVINATFEAVSLGELTTMDDATRDALPFGVVGLDTDGIVTVYNATEARMAGLDRESVIGVPFFEAIAQCMNNFMVAQRFEDEPDLDTVIPYVLTLRMRPTRVRLRLLAVSGGECRYVLIAR